MRLEKQIALVRCSSHSRENEFQLSTDVSREILGTMLNLFRSFTRFIEHGHIQVCRNLNESGMQHSRTSTRLHVLHRYHCRTMQHARQGADVVCFVLNRIEDRNNRSERDLDVNRLVSTFIARVVEFGGHSSSRRIDMMTKITKVISKSSSSDSACHRAHTDVDSSSYYHIEHICRVLPMISLGNLVYNRHQMELGFSWIHNGQRLGKRTCFSSERNRYLLNHVCLRIQIETMIRRTVGRLSAGCLQTFVVLLLMQRFL